MVSWEAWSALLSVYFFICRVSRASAAHDSGSMVLSVALLLFPAQVRPRADRQAFRKGTPRRAPLTFLPQAVWSPKPQSQEDQAPSLSLSLLQVDTASKIQGSDDGGRGGLCHQPHLLAHDVILAFIFHKNCLGNFKLSAGEGWGTCSWLAHTNAQ